METDEPAPDTSKPAPEGDPPKAASAKEADEPSSYVLDTPARVVPAQEKYIAFDADERWQPLRRASRQAAGVLLLIDNKPGESSPVPAVASKEGVCLGCPALLAGHEMLALSCS